MTQQTISIIVPAYNEAANLKRFHRELKRVLRELEYDFEILFVNDGSSDRTQKVIDEIAGRDERVVPIEFVRNFGKEVALTAGLNRASGAAAIMIDADLQHPVELIPEFIERWETEEEHIVGLRVDTRGASWFKRNSSKMFYALLARLAKVELRSGYSDYQLVDRAVINEFNRFTERGRITRGLLSWLGFPVTFIEFTADERRNGTAGYSKLKLMQLAANSFVSLSLFPLRIAGYLGLLISFFSAVAGIYMYLDSYVFDDPFGFNFTGTGFLAMLILFLVGLLLSCLGLVALYIGAIHNEVLNRPLYVVRDKKK